MVRAKKHLGQHFLKEPETARKIAMALRADGYRTVLEIGPGTGVLTQFLMDRDEIDLYLSEVDTESIEYLQAQYLPYPTDRYLGNFLALDLAARLPIPCGIIGNFPYNISSQILFQVYDQRQHVPEVVGMFQKEVAERVAASPGSKTYGILSVLLQAFYDIEYLFTVKPGSFNPPPKVNSGVIRLVRNDVDQLACDEVKFKQVVKLAFNQRRKTLRNALKSLIFDGPTKELEVLNKRAEQLNVAQFVELTQHLQEQSGGTD
ncbi:MAG: 16S rRNA (adenine(1518)-N(6)/adenine(1519)-N(6))-dimethyltransferase RsmA [Flavobacteriales bacterium]|nr:16S rRNA (adenine(1518)-N(6)/adenine(1519)-N(6))-dimethyltransferase RsmA [Flavobacteriales bacterium]